MSFTLPSDLSEGGNLSALTDREGVSDALYRVVLAFDNADEDLLRSAVTETVSMSLLDINVKGVAEMKDQVFDRVSRLDTTHFLSNIRVQIDDSATAQATCSAMAQHVRTGQGMQADSKKFTTGGLYRFQLVKVGRLWKITSWKAKMIWVDGDQSVLGQG